MHAEQANYGEIPEHAVQRPRAIVTCNSHSIFAPFLRGELFVDLGALDERIEDIQDRVAAPCVWIFTEKVSFFFLRSSAGDSISIAAEGFKLVDEFVYYIPRPIVLFEMN